MTDDDYLYVVKRRIGGGTKSRDIASSKLTDKERLWRFIQPEPNSGCWLWEGCLSYGGYGMIRVRGQTRTAHRFAYEVYVGEIPDALQLDHLCRVRSCVNPDHLEPVTPKENSQRGETGKNHKDRTHCPQGHPYEGSNLYLYAESKRGCRTCRRESGRRYRAKLKEIES